jgi:hypothetical protein
MLSAGHRTAVIIGMWIAVGIGLWGVGIYGAETGRDIGWLLALAILLPVLTTLLLSGALPGFSFGSSGQEKAKRQSDRKLALLLELMDEDERRAFKEALKQRILEGESDGELPYDAGLLEMLDQDRSTFRRSR